MATPASRKVIRLDVEPEFDFSLLALVCSLKDYKICFELNASMALGLKRDGDIEVFDKDHNRSMHANYACVCEDGIEVRVVSNKGTHTRGYFIPEKKSIHYFMMLRNANQAFVEDFLHRLKRMAWLEGAYAMDPAGLKSAEHFLLFD